MNTNTRIALGTMTFVAALAVNPWAAEPPAARLLFIGNSLTFQNDLPAMVEAVAAQAGLSGRVTCRAVAFADYSLEDHWKDGRAVRAIQAGTWTHIVLQQGPSSLPESQTLLREYTKKFAREARQKGARVVLFSVWPSRARAAAFDAVTASYTRAAEDVDGILVPAGEAWRAGWRHDGALAFYGPDGFHPSPLGSYLAALALFERITGRSPVGLPPPSTSRHRALRDVRIAPAQLAILQQAALEAGAALRSAGRP